MVEHKILVDKITEPMDKELKKFQEYKAFEVCNRHRRQRMQS